MPKVLFGNVWVKCTMDDLVDTVRAAQAMEMEKLSFETQKTETAARNTKHRVEIEATLRDWEDRHNKGITLAIPQEYFGDKDDYVVFSVIGKNLTLTMLPRTQAAPSSKGNSKNYIEMRRYFKREGLYFIAHSHHKPVMDWVDKNIVFGPKNIKVVLHGVLDTDKGSITIKARVKADG